MAALEVSDDELRRVHREMCVAVPLERLSPLLVTTLAVVARCQARRRAGLPPLPAPASRLCAPTKPAPIDLKRRAAGDID